METDSQQSMKGHAMEILIGIVVVAVLLTWWFNFPNNVEARKQRREARAEAERVARANLVKAKQAIRELGLEGEDCYKTDHDEVFKEIRRFGNEAIAALEKDRSESADIIKKSIRATLRFAKENLENNTIKGARTHMRTTIKICAHTGWAVDFYYDILKSPCGDDETRMDFYKKIDEPGMADWHLERLLEKDG